MSNEQGVVALSSWASVLYIMKKKKQNYAELLKDPRWQTKAKEIKEWDRGVCQLCGDNKNLQVHHLCYDKDRMPWDYPRRALITLCDNCHNKIHDSERIFQQHLKDLVIQLGLNGVSKNTILLILKNALKDSAKYTDENIFDNVWSIPYSEPFWVFGREYKNNIFEKERLRDREFLRLAKKAYEWNTGRKDFSEEDALNGEYYDDIREYKREFGIE